MTLENWYYLTNIFAPIITGVGIFISLYMSIKSIKEIRKDRVNAQKPYLTFVSGGYRDKAIFKEAGKSSPGFNPKYISELFRDQPDKSISIRREFLNSEHGIRTFGVLENMGSGTAFDIKIAWIPKIIWLNGERFIIDDNKSKEAKYAEINNTMLLNNSVLYPRSSSGILHWPMFIEKDWNLQITRVEGYFKIFYKDSLNIDYITYQKYHLFTQYKDQVPTIHVTFCDVFSKLSEWDNDQFE